MGKGRGRGERRRGRGEGPFLNVRPSEIIICLRPWDRTLFSGYSVISRMRTPFPTCNIQKMA